MASKPYFLQTGKAATRSELKHAFQFPFRVLAVGILLVVGCQQARVADSDPVAARAVLNNALEAWGSGKTTADLRIATPPVYVAEDLWQSGNSLSDFDVEADHQMIGTNVCFKVTLKTTGPSGQLQTKSLKYLVTTTPAQTIARLDQ